MKLCSNCGKPVAERCEQAGDCKEKNQFVAQHKTILRTVKTLTPPALLESYHQLWVKYYTAYSDVNSLVNAPEVPVSVETHLKNSEFVKRADSLQAVRKKITAIISKTPVSND